jgi:hypothetical protein
VKSATKGGIVPCPHEAVWRLQRQGRRLWACASPTGWPTTAWIAAARWRILTHWTYCGACSADYRGVHYSARLGCGRDKVGIFGVYETFDMLYFIQQSTYSLDCVGLIMRKKRLLIGCSVLFLCVIIGLCITDGYIMSQFSSNNYLQRLAGVSELGTFDETQQALSRQVPRGTSKADILAYLEAHNVHEDRFESGQWMRYQIQERKVLVLLSDPSFPWHINIACNHFGYILHFNLDARGALEDVVINSSAVCL